MEIQKINFYRIKTPYPHKGGPLWTFVKLTTDEGIEGWGEAYHLPIRESSIKVLKEMGNKYVMGTNPLEIERLFLRFFSSEYAQHPDFITMGATSAFEIACWDIIGKSLNKPVFELMGGRFHDKLRTYTYLYPSQEQLDKGMTFASIHEDPEKAAERASNYVELGFTAVKLDPIISLPRVIPIHLNSRQLERFKRVIKSVREAVGDSCDILIGTHGQMTVASAIQLAKCLESYAPMWFEEPVPPSNITEMSEVAARTSIPIATGERLSTKYEFAQLLRYRCASILQPDIGRVGGILETKKIAAMAEAQYAQIAPHLWCGPMVLAASVQVDVGSPNFLIQESIERFDNFHSEILKNPIEWEKGYLIPSARPGLGYEPNEEKLTSFLT